MLAKSILLASFLFALGQTTPAPQPNPSRPTAPQASTPQSSTPQASTPQSNTARPTGQSTPAPRPGLSSSQSATPAGSGSQTTPRPLAPRAQAAAPAPKPSAPEVDNDCGGAPCDAPPPKQIVVTSPPAPPQPWTWHDKIAWAAYVILAFLGYAGIMISLSVLKKIERNTSAVETAAHAALESAQAALLNAQAVSGAERPWLLISVEPSLTVEDGFTVMATNRGKSPAQIAGTAERIRTAPDESRLPRTPEYDNREPASPMVPVILLPGESTGIKSFSRADAKGLCENDEQFARIESWEERVFLYGKVLYKDLVAPPDKQQHQTDWCCWYIHGRQKSGLVIAGPPGYNLHT